MTSRDSNIQHFDLESDALPLRHEVLTEIGSKKNKEKLLGCWKVKIRLCPKQMYFRKLLSQTDCLKTKLHDLDVIRTRNLLIWSQTRNHCAMKYRQRLVPKNIDIRMLEGQRTFMSEADVLQKACESN